MVMIMIFVDKSPNLQFHVYLLCLNASLAPGDQGENICCWTKNIWYPQVRNYSVSWIRTRDSAILAIDGDTVVRDSRVSVIRTRRRGDYVLSIRSIQDDAKIIGSGMRF